MQLQSLEAAEAQERLARLPLPRSSSHGTLKKLEERSKNSLFRRNSLSSINLVAPTTMTQSRMGFLDDDNSFCASEDENDTAQVHTQTQKLLVDSIKERMRKQSGPQPGPGEGSESNINEFDTNDESFSGGMNDAESALTQKGMPNLNNVDFTALRESQVQAVLEHADFKRSKSLDT